MTKKCTHASVVVNRAAFAGVAEVAQLCKIITWLLVVGVRHVSVFDREGLFCKHKSLIATEVERAMELQGIIHRAEET
jgi:hypothetical protein